MLFKVERKADAGRAARTLSRVLLCPCGAMPRSQRLRLSKISMVSACRTHAAPAVPNSGMHSPVCLS
jgi:hypothetical protein